MIKGYHIFVEAYVSIKHTVKKDENAEQNALTLSLCLSSPDLSFFCMVGATSGTSQSDRANQK